MKLRSIVFIVSAMLTALPAGAQELEPGLWEITNKAQSGSGEMEQAMAKMKEQMAAMPEEQRKMMEAMMARQGMGMNPATGAIKMCITPDQAKGGELYQRNGDCKSTNTPIAGGMKIAFTCTNPPSSGEGQITFSGGDAFAMKMAVTSTSHGKPETMNVESTGKWLGADCGDIKPRTAR